MVALSLNPVSLQWIFKWDWNLLPICKSTTHRGSQRDIRVQKFSNDISVITCFLQDPESESSSTTHPKWAIGELVHMCICTFQIELCTVYKRSSSSFSLPPPVHSAWEGMCVDADGCLYV